MLCPQPSSLSLMRRPLDKARPSVVIAGFALSTLGVVRCLARYGIRSWVLSANARNLALKSRHVTPRHVASLDPDALGAALREIADHAGAAPVILPTEDHIVRLLSQHRGTLGCGLPDLLPDDGTLVRLMSKTTIGACFARAGIDYPRTVTATFAGDPAPLEGLRYPAILKPDTKPPGFLRHFRKAYIVQSAAEALDLMRRMSAFVRTAVVQEYIPGPDTEIFFCLAVAERGGRLAQSFVGCKLASWPVGTGNTVACVPAPADVAQRIRTLTERFFRENGFFGIGSVEFKRAPSGEFFGIEPTLCRVNAQSEIAVLNGVDLPLAWYALATGQDPPPPRKVPPRGWLDPFLRAHLGMAGGWRPPPAGTPPLTDALWRWTDPGPWLAYHRPRLRHAPHALRRHLTREHVCH